MSVREAADALRRGGFVLLHDAEGRENEFDMVAAAQFVTPGHVATMRSQAGGLLCTAVEHGLAARLGLPYMHNILAGAGLPPAMIQGLAPYGDHPTFSIYVNHASSYTGVTDTDRSRTIREVAALYDTDHTREEFARSFRTPGHVPLLVASEGLLESRVGHTEMSVYLVRVAGLRPVAAICEMMDSHTHSALDADGAAAYAKRHGLPTVESQELLEHAGVGR